MTTSTTSTLSGSPELRAKAPGIRATLAATLRGLALAAAALLPTAVDADAQDTPTPRGPEGLKRVGPINSFNGFPYWYEDKTGLKLGPCQDPALCFFRANPLAPISFPATRAEALAGNFNYPDEVFYYAAENLEIAPLPTRARLLWHVAIEGAFMSGRVMPGEQVVFARLRVRLRNLLPETAYTIRHPYGQETLRTDVDGGLFYTRDLGIAVGDFSGAVYGDLGPFLVPVGFNRNAPKGTFLSNAGATLETVEGSPLGRNYVEYEGPGIGLLFPGLAVDGNPNLVRSSVFSLQGQVAEQYGVGIDDAYYSATGSSADSSLSTKVTVFAQSAEGQNMIARAQNGAWAPMQEQANQPGHYFAQLDFGGNNSALPTNLEVHNGSDAPVTSKTMATIPDLVSVHSATLTLGQNGAAGALSVDVTSTDQSQSRTVDVELADLQVTAGLTGGQGDAAISQPVPATYVPPPSVTVRSSAGGETTFPLEVVGAGKTAQTPQNPGPVADAGADLGFDPGNPVLIRTVVTLSASASSGAIANYMWSPPVSGFEIDTVASQGAQLVGLMTLAGDHVFSVTVIDNAGRVSTDSVTVRVTDPNAVRDTVTIVAARYDVGRQLWDVSGATSVYWNQRIDIYFALLDATGAIVRDQAGSPMKDANRRIGSAFAGDLGLWRYRGNATALLPGTLPTGLDTTIVVESALGGKAAIPFRVSR